MANIQSYQTRFLAGALFALTTLWVGASAQAEQFYSLSGAFARGEGVVVNLPVIGNSQGALCNSLVGVDRLGAGVQGTTPPIVTAPSPAAPNGCVPGIVQTVSVGTAGPRASFMLPTNFFSQPEDNIPNKVLVPIPSIISLTTDLNFYGPLAAGPQIPLARQTTVVGTPPPAVWNQFREGAWATQSNRAGLNFTWCVGNANCTTVNQGGGGIIKYSNTDANGFGGTMSVVLAPGDVAGSLPIIGAAGGAAGPNSILVVPVQAPVTQGGGGPGDLGGKGYAAIQTGMAAPAQVYANYMVSSGGFLTALTSPVFPTPGTTNTSNQMPWTTGMVLGRAILPTAMGNPNTFTFAQTGSDNRTALGEGNLNMVASSIRFANGSGTLTPHFNGIALSFVPEPGALGLLAAGSLFVIGVTRKRRA